MKYLLSKAIIIDATSVHHKQQVDLLIVDGTIIEIGKIEAQPDYTTIDLEGFYIAPGFCDLFTSISDPGYEHRENIESGTAAAAYGGFTAICTSAETNPIIQSKTQIEYLVKAQNKFGIDIYPLGAVTENMEGKNPTEMYDMQLAGAVGFSDAPHAIKNSGVMVRALQYGKPFNGTIFTMAYDETLVADGQVNEGLYAVEMGMRGISNLSEELQIQRDIELVRYTGGKIHFFGISTKKGIEMIKEAKKEGLNISASAFPHHLFLTDKSITDFDANYKVMPPLRSNKDQKALIDAVIDGTIDAIVSQHIPLEIEAKDLEFEYAGFGIIGLETAFALSNTILNTNINVEQLVALFSVNPRKIVNKPLPPIQKGSIANLSIFSINEEWQFEKKDIKSKSKNTPFIGTKLKGRVKGIFHKGKLNLNY
ncbi:MAG: dihydroorotase [Bacteroidetes bacterium]|nr:dihydroorotase [Bacteroidota bacterium]